MTLLLTARSPRLYDDFARTCPGIAALPLGSEIPPAVPPGPLWCFVDWLLPDGSGLEMVRRLRESPATRGAHITMVLETDADPDDKRRALRAGADDYMIGPLEGDALAGRIQRLAHARPAAVPALVHGDLSLDRQAHQARYRGAPLALTPGEFGLLAHFIENPDQVFARAALVRIFGQGGRPRDVRTVDVWIGRLRRALAAQGVPDPLRTVRSLGYVLDSPRPAPLPDQATVSR